MVEFIKQEANEKANEILIKAGGSFAASQHDVFGSSQCFHRAYIRSWLRTILVNARALVRYALQVRFNYAPDFMRECNESKKKN
jgi:hypothetical protein